MLVLFIIWATDSGNPHLLEVRMLILVLEQSTSCPQMTYFSDSKGDMGRTKQPFISVVPKAELLSPLLLDESTIKIRFTVKS